MQSQLYGISEDRLRQVIEEAAQGGYRRGYQAANERPAEPIDPEDLLQRGLDAGVLSPDEVNDLIERASREYAKRNRVPFHAAFSLISDRARERLIFAKSYGGAGGRQQYSGREHLLPGQVDPAERAMRDEFDQEVKAFA